MNIPHIFDWKSIIADSIGVLFPEIQKKFKKSTKIAFKTLTELHDSLSERFRDNLTNCIAGN